MAINWGIALGQAAKTGLETYERLGEEELRQMQREKMRKEMQQEKALDALYAEKLGKVGKDVTTYTPDMTTPEAGYYPAGTEPKEALPAGRAGANYVSDSDGMALKETTKQYTQKQALSDIARDAATVGGRKGALEAMQFKSAARASDIEEQFDNSMQKLNNTLATIQGTAESGGLKGLAEAAKKEGLKVEFVEGKNGVGKINVLGPKGDVIETVTSVGDATSKLEQLAMKSFMSSSLSLLGSYDKVAAYLQGERKLDIQGRESDAKARYYSEVANAYARGDKAKTVKKDVTNADVMSFVKEYGDSPSNEKDPKTGKPIPIRALPIAQQAAYAREFFSGVDSTGGGLPDVPKGGLKLEKPGPKAAQPTAANAPRRFEGQKFGALTPRAVVEEAARAGNPEAIRFLEGQERNKLAQEMDYGNNMPL